MPSADAADAAGGGSVVDAARVDVFLRQVLGADGDGYVGVEVYATAKTTEVMILTTRPRAVLGPRGRRTRELGGVLRERFGFAAPVLMFTETVAG